MNATTSRGHTGRTSTAWLPRLRSIPGRLRKALLVCFITASFGYLSLTIWLAHEYLRFGPQGQHRALLAQRLFALTSQRRTLSEVTNVLGAPSLYRGLEAERPACMLAVDKADAVVKARNHPYTALFHIDANTTAFVFFDAQTNAVAYAVGTQ